MILILSLQKFQEVKVKVKSLSPVRLFVTPGTIAHQAPASMGFPRQEYWSGKLPSPQDLPDPGIKPRGENKPSNITYLVFVFFFKLFMLYWSVPN